MLRDLVYALDKRIEPKERSKQSGGAFILCKMIEMVQKL